MTKMTTTLTRCFCVSFSVNILNMTRLFNTLKLDFNHARAFIHSLFSRKWVKFGFYCSFICFGMTGSCVHLFVEADQFIFVYQRSIIFTQQIKNTISLTNQGINDDRKLQSPPPRHEMNSE